MDEVYRFGRFVLNADRLRLQSGSEVLEVEPKPLEVLAELLRNPGELVTKNELMDSVWAGRIITESVIARCISKLRGALEDHSQTLILNVHGYGYRFTGAVERVGEAEPGPAPAVQALVVGDSPPLRPHWRLARTLDDARSVWLAEHAKTGERRVFKFAMDMRQVRGLKRELTIHRLLQRSLGERDDIARLLDYNLDTLPYFLELEYCQQGTLVDWSAAQGGVGSVPLTVRIELAAQAADALAAAHAVGVLHLDIKPSNLLIWGGRDGSPRARWTDFGSARLDDAGRLAGLDITRLASTSTLAASPSSPEGTLQYLAPELLSGDAPTVRSDLYALGVMLYQLVAGDLRKPMTAGWEDNVADEILRSDIAAAANGNPAARPASAEELAHRLRGLERRRNELRDRRRQEGEAAQLRRRLERTRARRPWVIAAGVALSLGLGASLWSYRQALLARDHAEQQAAIATGVGRFLTEDVFGAVSAFDPVMRRDFTVQQAMDRAVAELDQQSRTHPQPPLVEAQIRSSIAYTYMQLADYDNAVKQTRLAAALFRGSLGPFDTLTLHARYGEAEDLMFGGRYGEADALLDRLDADLTSHPEIDPDVRLASAALHGATFLASEQYARALPYYRKALELALQSRPHDAAALATRHSMLALTCAHLGAFDEADEQMRQALQAAALDDRANRDTTTALTQEASGVIRYLEGRNAEAEALLSVAHRVLAQNIGPDEAESAESQDYLGLVYLDTQRAAQAETTAREAWTAYKTRYGESHPSTLIALSHLGMAEAAAGHKAAGAADLRRAYDGLLKSLGPMAPDTQYTGFRLALSAPDSGTGKTTGLLARLDPKILRQAAPRQAWPAGLEALRSQHPALPVARLSAGSQ